MVAERKTKDLSGNARYHECANNRFFLSRPCGKRARQLAGLDPHIFPARVPNRTLVPKSQRFRKPRSDKGKKKGKRSVTPASPPPASPPRQKKRRRLGRAARRLAALG